MKSTIATLGAAATLALSAAFPAAAFAQTASYQYEYVNTSGQIQTITAADATTALDTAPNLALHSGVIYVADSTQMLPNSTVSL